MNQNKSNALSNTKHAIQFSTICLLFVILTGCQSLTSPAADAPSESIPDPNLEADTVFNDVQIPVAIEEEEEEPTTVIPPPEEEPVAVETDLWQRIRDGFQLDHNLDQPRVQAEFDWFLRHQDYLDRVATRASRHLYYIVQEIEARGLPTELALLPIVESAFDPFAYSHGRASGLWQFIPSTGKRYGLTIDYWMDGRRDVPEATGAALDYLEALYGSLDQDWFLALAAYNSGEGNVRHSMRKNRRAGKPLDFWSLGLLAETRAYVPRLLAISALVADPEKYDIELKPIKNEPYWQIVDIGSQLDLAKAAELADISTEELYLLNPGFNRWSTRPGGPHRLLIPIDKVATFEERLASLPPSERVSWTRHRIKEGESLSVIATRYRTTVDSLRVANNLRGSMIRAGDSLLIPVATRDSDAYGLSESERLKAIREYAQRKLGTEPVDYTVAPGDSFWEIARRFQVPMRSLAKWNGMATTDVLTPGRKLVIFTGEPLQLASLPAQNEVIRKVNYRVRRGESLSLIADKFNLSVSNIKKWNRDIGERKYIQPGDRITLFVDVTQTE